MAEYSPRSFLRLIKSQIRTWQIFSHLDLTLGQKRILIGLEREKRFFQPVITLHRYLCFRDYKDYYTDTSVKFLISMTEDKLAEAEQSGLHKKFKLESTISTSNMVRFLGETRSFDNYSG